MQVQGTVKVIGQTKEVSASFKKRELVVTTKEQYPQHILIEFVQDKVDLLNGLKVGEDVTVQINLQGREWTNPQGEVRYFNSLKGWRVEAAAVSEVVPEAKGVAVDEAATDEDLPF